jgi:hypothetical protein
MLEIAGGTLLAVVILIFVLANFGRIILGLSILFAVVVVVVAIFVLAELPSDIRNASLIVVALAAALVAFGYWTHHDKRVFAS